MQCGDLKSRLVRKSCSATAWAVRAELSVTEDLTPMSSLSSQRKKGRKKEEVGGEEWVEGKALRVMGGCMQGR